MAAAFSRLGRLKGIDARRSAPCLPTKDPAEQVAWCFGVGRPTWIASRLIVHQFACWGASTAAMCWEWQPQGIWPCSTSAKSPCKAMTSRSRPIRCWRPTVALRFFCRQCEGRDVALRPFDVVVCDGSGKRAAQVLESVGGRFLPRDVLRAELAPWPPRQGLDPPSCAATWCASSQRPRPCRINMGGALLLGVHGICVNSVTASKQGPSCQRPLRPAPVPPATASWTILHQLSAASTAEAGREEAGAEPGPERGAKRPGPSRLC